MNKYVKTFYSIDGQKFRADVYDVLKAFGVTCHARGHAIKKLLMPGQRGVKGEIQDLDEALASVSRAIDMAYARLRDSDGANDEPEPMAEAEPEPDPEPMPEAGPEPDSKPELVTWRLCVQINTRQIYGKKPWAAFVEWWPSENTPEHWYALESQSQPIETVKQLPEGQEP